MRTVTRYRIKRKRKLPLENERQDKIPALGHVSVIVLALFINFFSLLEARASSSSKMT